MTSQVHYFSHEHVRKVLQHGVSCLISGCGCSSKRMKRFMFNNIAFIIHILLFPSTILASDQVVNQYKKPFPSNGPCIDSIEQLEEVFKESKLTCLGCYDNAQSSCPSSSRSGGVGCQSLIDNMYRNCDKINLPQRFFFDPPVSNS